MLNCYRIHFTTGEVIEFFRQKMTRREYDWIIDGLVEATYESGTVHLMKTKGGN